MAIKGSGRVTLTLYRTTVEKLRDAKGGGAWDAFLLDLVRRNKQGTTVECVRCRKKMETENIDYSPRRLAEKNGWMEISVKGRLNGIGFMCGKCLSNAEEREQVAKLQ